MARVLTLVLALLVMVPAAVPDSLVRPARAGSAQSFATSQAAIVTRSGHRYTFRVELARTYEERVQGLQGRTTLAADAGMLFEFDSPQLVTMWMKNTPLALDMVFIGADGRIVNIARDTTPLSLELIRSAGLVKGVLELRAGTTARLGIRPGDRVVHEMFE